MEFIIVIAIIGYLLFRRKKKQDQQNTSFADLDISKAEVAELEAYGKSIDEAIEIEGNGLFGQEIKGEQAYSDNIATLHAYMKTVDPLEDEFVAVLIPEPTNKHDSNAVMVLAGNLLLGYIPREQAADIGNQVNGLGGIVKCVGKLYFDPKNHFSSISLDLELPLRKMT